MGSSLPAAAVADATHRVDLRIELNYQVDAPGAHFVFNVHAAHTPSQTLRTEDLVLSPPIAPQMYTDLISGNRCMRLRAAPGPLKLAYSVSLDLLQHRDDPAAIDEVPLASLPSEVLGFLCASRHCPSDQLTAIADVAFGTLPKGYGRIQAIRDHVRADADIAPGDLAHRMIALCRAVQVPARFVTGVACGGADLAWTAPRLQACVEVYLGHRWYILDPSTSAEPTGFVRFGTGRDAADVAFATVFGSIASRTPIVSARTLGASLADSGRTAVSNDSAATRCASDRLSMFALRSVVATQAG